MRLRLSIYACIVYFLFCQDSVFGQERRCSLDEYLKIIVKDSQELKAIELDIQSLQMEIQARDVELSPTLSVEFERFWDHRPSLSSNYQIDGQTTDVVLSKPLASGTTLTLSSGIEDARYRNTPDDQQNLLNWQMGITQSLWQNSFGHQTSLRRERDQHERKSRLLTLLLKQQQAIVDFESLYWDMAYAQEEVTIRQENLNRSGRVLDWIQERVNRSAAEHIDLLQGQTLVASRQLQLQLAEDHFKTLQAQLNSKLHSDFKILPLVEDLRNDRPLFSLPIKLDFAPQNPVLIETLQAKAEADLLNTKAKLEGDQLKPELEIGYSYGKMGVSTSFSQARRQEFSNGNDYHQVGVVFSMPLDFMLISKSIRAFELAAQAQKIRFIQSQRQSDVQWQDLERTVNEQRQRVDTAMRLAKLQNDKSSQQRVRYEKGRTTAFESISFEQEAAEGDLLVLQLINQLRKTEAQARIYSQKKDGIN